MIQQKIADIDGEQIKLYPNAVWTVLGYALLALFTLTSLFFIVTYGLFTMLSISLLLISSVVVVLPFFYIGGRQVVVDGATKTVRLITLFGTRKTYRFSELSGVDYVKVDNLYDPVEQGYYRLLLANDAYGMGIRLTAGQRVTAPAFVYFKKVALPFIQALLVTEPVAQKAPKNKITFSQFTQRDGVYTSKLFRQLNLGLAVGFSGLFFAYFLGSDVSFEKDPPLYLITFFANLAAIGVNAALWGQQVTIDTANRLIRPSYFGLFGTSYSFDEVKGIGLVKHLAWGTYHNGTDIRIRLKSSTAADDVLLFYRVRKNKRIRQLVEELNYLLATPK